MSIKAALYNRLLDDATISGIVGKRVIPQFASSEENKPYIIFERTGKGNIEYFEGTSDLKQEVFTFLAIVDTGPEDAETLKNAIESSIISISRQTLTGVEVIRAFLNNTSDDFELPDFDKQMPLFYDVISFNIWYRE